MTEIRKANHFAIFKNVSITPAEYPYFAAQTISLDFDGMLGVLRGASARSVFLLHACAHNPTGIDPTEKQWEVIADVMLERGHYAFFDCAYQGFASGDLDKDAWAVRYFMNRGVPMLVCQVGSMCQRAVDMGAEKSTGRALQRTRGCTESVSVHCTL